MPAEDAYVLSPTDVQNIRSYVQHKYAGMPQEKRAEIVADAVSRIIHKQLPDFEESIKREVTARLIRTAVLEHQRPVRADDIMEACLALDRTQTSIQAPLHSWVEGQLRMSCEAAVLTKILDELSLHSNRTGNADSRLWARLERTLAAQESVSFLTAAPEAVQAEIIELPIKQTPDVVRKRVHARTAIYGGLSVCLVAASLLYGWSLSKPPAEVSQPPVVAAPVVPETALENVLPEELRYQDIDRDKLIAYLESKSSVLADQPYFDAIISAAEDFDLHPVLLFAITGQEQGFVPKTNKQHKEIANNPFNVFHSWQDFNTNIEQSAEIAARTVYNLSKDRPDDVDPFTWINRKYAEDPKWSDGVRSIFATIVHYLEQ